MNTGKQLWFGVSCACVAAAVIWQPRFHRELIVIAVAVFTIGVARYLKDTINPG